MYKAYRFRMYPTKEQELLMKKTFGCVRFVYNYYLDKCKKEKSYNAYAMCKSLKELEEKNRFLKECDSCSLRCALFNLEDAFKNYFAQRGNYPVFKNKYVKQSYRTNAIRRNYKGKDYTNIEIDLEKKEIKLPKLKRVKIRGYRNLKEINGKVINATIIKETTGKYYVSIVVEEREKQKEKVISTSIVGIDLGVHSLIATSNGEIYENPKHLNKKEKRLKRLQRKLSRCEKDSKNRNKVKIKIAILHSKIKNARKHNIIDMARKIVQENDIIVS